MSGNLTVCHISPIRSMFFVLLNGILIGALHLNAQNAYKQYPNYNDAQIWENIYYEKNMIRKLNIHFNEEGRLTENFTQPSYIYVDMGITYKFKKYLHFTLAYVPILKKNIDNTTYFNHQFYFDWVLKLKAGKFIFYDRQMFQSQYGDINRSATWNVPGYYLRHKITVKYRLTLRYTPYVASELYYHDNANEYNGVGVDHMRFFFGCFYWLDSVNELEIYYLLEPHFNGISSGNGFIKHFDANAPYTNYIIGLGYAHNLF